MDMNQSAEQTPTTDIIPLVRLMLCFNAEPALGALSLVLLSLALFPKTVLLYNVSFHVLVWTDWK